jgi:hypothetical protein
MNPGEQNFKQRGELSAAYNSTYIVAWSPRRYGCDTANLSCIPFAPDITQHREEAYNLES